MNVSPNPRDPGTWWRNFPSRAVLEKLIDEDPRSELAKAASAEIRLREKEAEQR